ncbi:MAG TPA: ATP-binding cassette domain-containing protein [Solirubrobacterales bacterium]|nr:ATP-binding cassette domain-containing protein [Solirubrobacterales bacterium]
MSAAPVVQAFGLGKDYGKLRAVEAVDISVGDGDFFGFLGPNGAGKTTMIHMLTTLVSPTRGRAEVAGHDVVAQPLAVRKNIGLVFQETTLDGELSAEENLQLAGKLYGLGRADLRARIAEVLALFELTDRRHDSVRTFSGGMRRQVDLARGILHRPAVLFLDEPTLGLDPVNRARVWEFLERLAREEGMTLFLTTHYLEEAEPCDRVMIVDRGAVIAQGTPDELKRDLGGSESIELVMSDPDPRLLAEIARRSGSEPRRTENGVIVAVDSAEAILPMLLPLIGERLESLSVRKPTLDDVFVAATTPGGAAGGTPAPV